MYSVGIPFPDQLVKENPRKEVFFITSIAPAAFSRSSLKYTFYIRNKLRNFLFPRLSLSVKCEISTLPVQSGITYARLALSHTHTPSIAAKSRPPGDRCFLFPSFPTNIGPQCIRPKKSLFLLSVYSVSQISRTPRSWGRRGKEGGPGFWSQPWMGAGN